MPITSCPLRRLLSLVKLACQLGQPLADNAIGPACKYVARNIIPVSRCPGRKLFSLCSIHVDAWLSIFAIRFTWSPVRVDREQSDHTSRMRLNPSSARYKPVLLILLAVSRVSGQTRFLQDCWSSPSLHPGFGNTHEPGPSLDGATHQVTVVVKPRPATKTGFAWVWVEIKDVSSKIN